MTAEGPSAASGEVISLRMRIATPAGKIVRPEAGATARVLAWLPGSPLDGPHDLELPAEFAGMDWVTRCATQGQPLGTWWFRGESLGGDGPGACWASVTVRPPDAPPVA